jgi:hypothetical protein
MFLGDSSLLWHPIPVIKSFEENTYSLLRLKMGMIIKDDEERRMHMCRDSLKGGC